MANLTVQKDNIGTVIRVTIRSAGNVVDVSGASTKQILLQKSDGTDLTKTASFTNDGTDGQIEYTTVSGDLDTLGVLQVQAKVVLSGNTFYSDVHEIDVLPNLN